MPKAETSLNELLSDLRKIEEHREVLSEKKIRKIYKQLLKELRGFIAETYALYADETGALTVAGLQRNAKLAWYLEEIERCCNKYLPDVSEEIRATVQEAYDICYEGMAIAVDNAYDLTALNVRPEVMTEAMRNDITKLTLPDLLEKNRKEIIYEIKQVLNIGLMNGERYETMARKLTERLDISYGKANNIVRTETHRNIEGGFMNCAEHLSEGLEGSGYIYAATWNTMQDERVRPQQRRKTKKGWKTTISKNGANHIKMDGVTIKVGDKFDLGNGVKAKAPSHSGVAAHDCRCRCFLEYNLMTPAEFEAATGKPVNIASMHRTDRQLMNDCGIADCQLERTTDYERFANSFEEARKSNTHGGAVDPVTVDMAKDFKCYIAQNNMAFVAIKDDGDITAVLKHQGYKQRGAVDDLILTARSNGGTKMDCYGRGLVNKYEGCGYVPVAKVKFNPEFATDEWLLKEQPDIYFMMKNTDDMQTAIKKCGAKSYHLSSQEELDALPVFDDVGDEYGYDRAYAWRDELLKEQGK